MDMLELGLLAGGAGLLLIVQGLARGGEGLRRRWMRATAPRARAVDRLTALEITVGRVEEHWRSTDIRMAEVEEELKQLAHWRHAYEGGISEELKRLAHWRHACEESINKAAERLDVLENRLEATELRAERGRTEDETARERVKGEIAALGERLGRVEGPVTEIVQNLQQLDDYLGQVMPLLATKTELQEAINPPAPPAGPMFQLAVDPRAEAMRDPIARVANQMATLHAQRRQQELLQQLAAAQAAAQVAAQATAQAEGQQGG